MRNASEKRPAIWLVGEADHPDFAEAVALVRMTAKVGPGLPELIVLVQNRPGEIGAREIARLRRSAPLAGMVLLVGSWCEGETRTGKPAAGVRRLYWYEFPSWWQRQMALWEAGLCPEWALPATSEGRATRGEERAPLGGLVATHTARWDTMAVLADVLRSAGCDSMWLQSGRNHADLGGLSAGIWEGGQLSDIEAEHLAGFCATLAKHNAPVVALLDFPRRDRCEVARQAGATAVLGKPWLNVDLVATLRQVLKFEKALSIPTRPCAA